MTQRAVDAFTGLVASRTGHPAQVVYECGGGHVGLTTALPAITGLVNQFHRPVVAAAAPRLLVDTVVDPMMLALARATRGDVALESTVQRHVSATFDRRRIDADLTLLTSPDGDPEGDLAIVKRGNRFTVIARDEASAANWTVWLMREISLRSLENQGGYAVRAAAVNVAGATVVLIGAKYAGKSTVATWLMENAGAQPLENSIVICVPDANGGLTAHGLQMPWRIADGTIAGSPTLAAAEPTRPWVLGRDASDGKLEITPREMADVFAVTPAPPGRIDAVVLPQQAGPGRSGLRRLARLDCSEVVPQNTYPCDYLGLRTSGPVATPTYSGTVLRMRWTPASLPRVAARLVDRVGRSGPAIG